MCKSDPSRLRGSTPWTGRRPIAEHVLTPQKKTKKTSALILKSKARHPPLRGFDVLSSQKQPRVKIRARSCGGKKKKCLLTSTKISKDKQLEGKRPDKRI